MREPASKDKKWQDEKMASHEMKWENMESEDDSLIRLRTKIHSKKPCNNDNRSHEKKQNNNNNLQKT